MLFDYRTTALAFAASCAVLAMNARSPAQPLAQSAPARCTVGQAGYRVDLAGLKDRTGGLRLELHPAIEGDFLQDDEALLRAGKAFRRITMPVPATGPVGLCIARGGIGVPGQPNVGRSLSKPVHTTVTVSDGISAVVASMQYLRGLDGLGPVQSI